MTAARLGGSARSKNPVTEGSTSSVDVADPASANSKASDLGTFNLNHQDQDHDADRQRALHGTGHRLKVIAAFAQRLISAGLYMRIVQLVLDAAQRLSAPGTGAEKKAWVLDRLSQEGGWIMAEAQSLPGWFVSLLVDVFVGRLKLDGKL